MTDVSRSGGPAASSSYAIEIAGSRSGEVCGWSAEDDDEPRTLVDAAPLFAMSEIENSMSFAGRGDTRSVNTARRIAPEAEPAVLSKDSSRPLRIGVLESARRIVAKSQAVQIAVASVVGVAILGVWVMKEEAKNGSWAGRRADTDRVELPSMRTPFPEVAVDGADPVRSEDVRRLFAAKRPTSAIAADAHVVAPAQEANASKKDAADLPVVRLAPGVVIDPDDPESRARANAAAEAWEAQRSRQRNQARRTEGDANVAGRVGFGAPGQSPQFFAPGGVLEGVGALEKEAAKRSIELSVGEQLFARLELGITSSRLGIVLARATKEMIVNGRRVLSKGAVLRGRASANDERIFVRFFEIEEGGEVHAIEGEAVEGTLPGLRAHRREATYEEKSSAAALRGTLGAVEGAARAIAPGTFVGEVADGVARETVPEAKDELEVQPGYVLEVPAGRTFVVVITGRGR